MECPACKCKRIVSGTVLNQLDYFHPRAYFRPKGLRPFAMTGITVNFKNNFFGCIDCGHVWADLDAKKLSAVMKHKGKENVKNSLGF